ncbi:MAG: hypothetical protein ACKODX_02650 [Gemmata sp.]
MKSRLFGVALLAIAVATTTNEAAAFGGRKSSDCSTSTHGGCGSYVTTYVDQKVTVKEWVAVKEEYKYTVSEPVTKKEKVKVKEQAWKDESFKYTVNELVTSKEKVKVAESKPVTKEVEFTTYTCVPVVTKQPRTVCEWVCVPVTVTCTAAPACGEQGGLLARLCGKKHNDCAAPCEPACPQVVTKTVMQRQKVTREIMVDVTTYNRVEKKEKKSVTTHETVWVEKEVNVTKCVPVEKTGTRKVAHWVDVEKEVNVTTCNKVEKTGTRDVMKCVPTEKVVKVAVRTFVPAPAPAPAATPCASPCESPCTASTCGGCGSGSKGGLFKGGLFKGGKSHGCGGCN